MKKLLIILFINVGISPISIVAQTEQLKTSHFAIVKMEETSAGGFGASLEIYIFYDDGKVLDGTTLIPGFKKLKFSNNFGSMAYILKYMALDGYDLITTSSAGIGQQYLYQYVFRKDE